MKQKYDALRKRLWVRMDRYETAELKEQYRFEKMTTLMYGEWSS